VRRYALLFCLLLLPAVVRAQNAPPILPAGDAAVAGFSGTTVVGSPPEPQRLDKTYINLDGPALRIIGLDRLGAPPQGQFVPAAKPFAATARQIGQVFSVALDNADPPNIYAAATSAYGLPIVVPDADGDGVPDRTRRGAANAAFMPGLFGPAIANGGPGSIWKIDGRTGAVSLFANVMLAGVPNSGPALGGLAFDPTSRQIFVADRDTGMIHRFTLDGVDRGQFDHGVQGLAAAQLPPAAFDPRKRINLQDPAFDSTKPATWGYPPIVRRVFGLGVYNSRLYYAVASGLRIWSVAIMPDGSFGADARIEIAVASGPQSSAEISSIAFDRDGRMLLAERDPPTGAYDHTVLATPAGGRALRFTPKQPGENRTPFYWQPDGDYALGFPPNFTNGNGGLALGYGYDSAGNIDRGSCGAWLWTTGEQLRLSRDRSIAARLRATGAEAVNGLQGNALELVRPQNVPPLNSYFMSYIDPAEQPGLMGQIGGIAIWQVCPRAEFFLPPEMLVGILEICPPGYEDVRDQCVPSPCKPEERYRNGKCVPECPVLRRSIRNECCPLGSIFDGRRCVQPKGPDLTVTKEIDRCGSNECYYTITIKNLGPGTYNGELVVVDVATSGQITSNSFDWVCSQGSLPNGYPDLLCKRQTSLAPGQSVTLKVKVTGANATGGLLNCALVDPRRDGNTSNNISCKYKPPPSSGNPKLRIVKSPPKECTLVSNDGVTSIWQCVFTVDVFNDGNVPSNNVTVTDQPVVGTLVGGVQQDGSWNCTSGNNSVTCRRPTVAPGPTPASFKVTVQVSVPNRDGAIRGGGVPEANNCAALGETVRRGDLLDRRVRVASYVTDPEFAFRLAQAQGVSPVSPGGGQTPPAPPAAPGGTLDPGGTISFPGGIPPGLLNPVLGTDQQSCATITLPVNPKNPPSTTCTPTRMPACSERDRDGRLYCGADQCDCSGAPIGPEKKPTCRPGECMTTCPASGTPPPLTIIPPPPTIISCPFPTFLVNGTCCTREAVTAGTCGPTVTTNCPPAQVFVNGTCCNIREYETGRCGGTTTQACPEGMRRGANGQCFVVDPGCRGPDCKPPTSGCAGGVARNSDGNCPTTTTGCSGGVARGADGNCPTPTRCLGGRQNVGGNCVCPTGTVEQGLGCVSKTDLCPNGKPKVNGQCPVLCPDGSEKKPHALCPTKGDSKKTTCGRGMSLVNGECVRRSTNLNQKNKSSDAQKLKSGRNVNTAPLVNAIGQGTKSSGGSGGRRNKGN
jgi:hypothetical protein